MTTITLRSSISGFLLVFLTRRRSKYSVVLHHTWHQKLFAKRSTVVHQQIFGLLVFSYLLFYLDNFLIGELLTKSSMTKFAEPTISFLNRFKKPSALKLKTFSPNFSLLKLMTDLVQESSLNTLGSKVLRLTIKIKFKQFNPAWWTKIKFKSTFQFKKERNLKSMFKSHLKNNRVMKNKWRLSHKFNLSILLLFQVSQES